MRNVCTCFYKIQPLRRVTHQERFGIHDKILKNNLKIHLIVLLVTFHWLHDNSKILEQYQVISLAKKQGSVMQLLVDLLKLAKSGPRWQHFFQAFICKAFVPQSLLQIYYDDKLRSFAALFFSQLNVLYISWCTITRTKCGSVFSMFH